jgi:hypothetical protein
VTRKEENISLGTKWSVLVSCTPCGVYEDEDEYHKYTGIERRV